MIFIKQQKHKLINKYRQKLIKQQELFAEEKAEMVNKGIDGWI